MVVVAISMLFLLAGVLSLVIARILGCSSTLKQKFDVFCRVLRQSVCHWCNLCCHHFLSSPSHTHFNKLVSFR